VDGKVGPDMIQLFKKQTKGFLGIDIGTSTIRAVELSIHGEQKKLENYASASVPIFSSTPLRSVNKGNLVFSTKRLAKIVSLVLKEAGMKVQKAAFSIPDFSTLFTSFSLPPMAEEEISQAVRFEARRHVPLPLSEVTLDWLVAKGGSPNQKEERMEILLVVVPNRIIDQYTEIAELCQLELTALEAEVFALQRALVGESQDTCCLIDIGAQSTTCNIVDRNSIRLSHSFDVAGNDLTEKISRTLNLSYKEAEILKENQGLLKGEKDLKKIIEPLLTMMKKEVKKTIQIFYEKEGKLIQSFIIAGSSASLPGLKEYFSELLEAKVKIGFPFSGMLYPPILEEELKKMSPGFSIAVGMALRGLA